MPQRLVDVFFEYLGRMAIGLLVIPTLFAAGFYVVDRSQTLTVRVWAEDPIYLSNATVGKEFAGATPAVGTQALALELLASDSFLDSIFSQAKTEYKAEGPDQKTADRVLARSNLKFAVAGPNLLVLTYTTDNPKAGVDFLNRFVAAVATSLVGIQAAQVAAMVGTVVNQLPGAKAAMEDALAKVHSYGAGETPAALLRDPAYQTLVADSVAKTNYYISLEDLSHQAQLLNEEIPSARNAMLRIMDPPATNPKPIDLKTPLVRNSLLALLAVVVAEALLLYVLAVRDPRVRSGQEVRARLGIQFLGSTPRLASR